MSLDNYVSSNKMALDLLYNSYHNDKLEDIVRKVYEKNKMLEYRDRLIQNADLIYLEPAEAGSAGFRTHFMAPVKSFAWAFEVLTLTGSISSWCYPQSSPCMYCSTPELLKRLILFFENTSIGRKRKEAGNDHIARLKHQ
jgi:hypothetical protein